MECSFFVNFKRLLNIIYLIQLSQRTFLLLPPLYMFICNLNNQLTSQASYNNRTLWFR